MRGCPQEMENLIRLPRFLDQWNVSDVQFEAWVTGFAGFFPRSRIVPPARPVA